MNADIPRKVFMSVDAVGGVWTYALELARGLASKGVAIELAVLGPAPSASQQRLAAEIPRLTLSITGLPLDWTAPSECELARASEELRDRAASSDADLVHLNAPAHAGLARWDLPLVVAAHSCVATWWSAVCGGLMPADLAWRAGRTAAGIAIADAVIAPSRSFARRLAAAYGNSRHISVVHNARTSQSSPDVRERDCILTAGRLWDGAKNVTVIDAAAASLTQPVYAAGGTSGPNGERRSFPNLTLLGPLDEAALAGWYARTAVFVSMSRYEPFGLSVLEAAQAGTALVLSEIDTFRELWDGAACFAPADDPDALAGVLDWLASNHEVRGDLAARARQRARSYSLERKLRGTKAAYRRAFLAHARRMQPRRAA